VALSRSMKSQSCAVEENVVVSPVRTCCALPRNAPGSVETICTMNVDKESASFPAGPILPAPPCLPACLGLVAGMLKHTRCRLRRSYAGGGFPPVGVRHLQFSAMNWRSGDVLHHSDAPTIGYCFAEFC
jgi:hypothetical protein